MSISGKDVRTGGAWTDTESFYSERCHFLQQSGCDFSCVLTHAVPLTANFTTECKPLWWRQWVCSAFIQKPERVST